MHVLHSVIVSRKALLKRWNEPTLEVWLYGESLLQCRFVVRSRFCSPAERIQHRSHYCIHVGGVWSQGHRLLSFLQCLRKLFLTKEDDGSLRVGQRRSKWNLEVSVIHEDTGVDDIYRRQILELFIGIKWRRAEFETREIHGADENRTIDRRRSIRDCAQPN